MRTSRARPLRLRAAVAPSALLLVLTQGCGRVADRGPNGSTSRAPEGSAAATLEASFPGRSDAVLHAGLGFEATATSFKASTPVVARARTRLSVELPRAASGVVTLRDEGGASVSLRELGITGAGRSVDHAVAYERVGGVSFWTALASGAEEWLRFDAGARQAGRPAATWRLTGATPVQRGTAVELTRSSAPSLWMSAPAAYAEGGEPVRVRLLAHADAVDLFVDDLDPSRAVLIDPMWTTEGPLPSVMEAHAAATLKNGKVLVAGGDDGVSFAIANAALFDPTSGTWTAATPMQLPRTHHTGTALGNGDALFAGGEDGPGGYLNEAEVFDPTTGAWTVVSTPMPSTHSSHTASLLTNGQVLLAGGQTSNSGNLLATDNVDLYDPTLGMGGGWGAPSFMVEQRYDHAATVLEDGTVLVTGGSLFPGLVLDSAEIYDPAQNTWTSTTGTMTTGRELHESILLPDGTVLLTGGDDGITLASAEIYDPKTQTFTATGSMSSARYELGLAPLPDGTVIAVGGSDGTQSLASTEIFDPAKGTWSAGPTLNEARSLFTLSPVSTGLLAAGGVDTAVVATTELLPLGAALGATCTTASDCGSGFCASGVCCETACTGACMACSTALKGSGTDGTCGPSTAGSNPGGLCTDQGASSCGTNGTCDGAGACASYPAGTSCTSTGACTTGTCQAGACVAELAGPGTTCSGNACCASGFCADGVCCDTACTGACMACTEKLKGAGSDGACGPAAAGTNPGNACTDQGSATCGTTGLCDGSGACAMYPNGASCGKDECATGTCESGACVDVHQLDGTPCTDGICIAGVCVLDPKVGQTTSASSSSGSFASSGAGGATSSTSGAGGQGEGGTAAAALHGDGCSVSGVDVRDDEPWSLFGAIAALGAALSGRRSARRRTSR